MTNFIKSLTNSLQISMLFSISSVLPAACVCFSFPRHQHFKDILIILIRQTTNITNSKQVHLNTHTAFNNHVQSRHYVSFNDTDVLYHVSITTSAKWKHRTYRCSTVPCSVYKCISHLNCRRKSCLFVEVTQQIF